jgi:hypothetical protein
MLEEAPVRLEWSGGEDWKAGVAENEVKNKN